MSDNNGNGNGKDKTATKYLPWSIEDDKEIAALRQASQKGEVGAKSVLQRFVTPATDENYREIFQRGFADTIKARLAAAAKAELEYCGLPLTPIIDMVTAESSTEVGALILTEIQGLTHSDFTITQKGFNKGKPHWFDRDKANNGISQQPE